MGWYEDSGSAIIVVIDARALRHVSSGDGARRGTIAGRVPLRHSGSRSMLANDPAASAPSLSANSKAHAQPATILLCSFHFMQGNLRT
jgi:hypothetical protein